MGQEIIILDPFNQWERESSPFRDTAMRFSSLILLLVLLIGCTTRSMDLTIADELDDYAQLLRENGSMGEAEEMASNAEKMRESDRLRLEAQAAFEQGRPYDTSFYLGFAPDAALRDYADALRAAGRRAEAKEANDLAVRYVGAQLFNAEQLMRQ